MSAQRFPSGAAVLITGSQRQTAVVVESGSPRTRCRLEDGRLVWVPNERLSLELGDSAARDSAAGDSAAGDGAAGDGAAGDGAPAPARGMVSGTEPPVSLQDAADAVGPPSARAPSAVPGERASLYPPGPAQAPADLASMTAAYRRHAWLASVGLALFITVYLGLTGWLVYCTVSAFRFAGAAGKHGFVGYLGGAVLTVISLFLVKGLFGIRRGGPSAVLELTAQDEPVLFDFLQRLADEVGAPRPHRVFISPEVNAAVFYDLSLANLLLPSRKNLMIGLGAVNSLTLSELKAVLAHEFGHFAQRSMAVGRWVYTTQQVAAHLVFQRDWLDRALAWCSRRDLRIAWIAWIFRLIVWAIRSVVDTLFGVVAAAERALSREMELQADLVSVSVTGSDALVHALHRLGGADEAWDRTATLLRQVLMRGASVEDAYAVQNEIVRRMRRILNRPSFCASPQRPELERGAFRVFEQELAQPPRMWLTHPPNREREDNAKRRHVDAPLDDRSAWSLFRDPLALRRKVTRELFVALSPDGQVPLPSAELTQKVIVEDYGEVALHPKFQGVYLGQPSVLAVAQARQLLDLPVSADELPRALGELYPPALRKDCELHTDLARERSLLRAFRDGHLDAPGQVVNYRGRQLPRSRVGTTLIGLERQIEQVRQRLLEQQRRCHSVHLALARELGGGWPEYLSGLLGLWHYTSHVGADLDDAFGHWHNTLLVALADGKVSRSERKRLVTVGQELHAALLQVHAHRNDVKLPERIATKLEVQHWGECLGEPFDHPAPNDENLASFVGCASAFAERASVVLGATQRAALIELLTVEEHLQQRHGRAPDTSRAPSPARVPSSHPVLLPGKERQVQTKLGLWDRFYLGLGFGPGLLRFAVASAIVLQLVAVTAVSRDATIHVHNGLGTPVTVRLGDQQLSVGAGRSAKVSVAATAELSVQARAGSRTIETRTVNAENFLSPYVYNVAAAVPLEEWVARYGEGAANAKPESRWQLEPWFQTDADHVLEPPPRELKTRDKKSQRSVLTAPGIDLGPEELLSFVPEGRRAAMIELHSELDSPRSPHAKKWRELARAATPRAPKTSLR